MQTQIHMMKIRCSSLKLQSDSVWSQFSCPVGKEVTWCLSICQFEYFHYVSLCILIFRFSAAEVCGEEKEFIWNKFNIGDKV